MQPGLVCLDDHPCHDKRRATEFKEVVGDSYLIHLQDRSKNIAESTLCVIDGSHISRTDSQLRFGQCLHISLPVRCHWHLCQLQIGSRHHVLCQPLADFGLQGIRCYLTVCRIVSTKVFLITDLTDHDDHLLHTLHREHDILNLS